MPSATKQMDAPGAPAAGSPAGAAPNGSQPAGLIRAVRASALVRGTYARLQRMLSGPVIRRSGRGHRVLFGDCRISRGSISISGERNTLEIGPGARLWDVHVELNGTGLVCLIGAHCRLRGATLVVEDRGSRLELGGRTTLIGAVIVASEGGLIRIGEDCLVAAGADIRNSDGHSILDGTGRRLNPAADIDIGRHVWLGLGTQVLKGVTMGEGSIAGARSLVNSDVPARSVAIGMPARIARGGVTWDHRRL